VAMSRSGLSTRKRRAAQAILVHYRTSTGAGRGHAPISRLWRSRRRQAHAMARRARSTHAIFPHPSCRASRDYGPEVAV